jgi:hypothetical protein
VRRKNFKPKDRRGPASKAIDRKANEKTRMAGATRPPNQTAIARVSQLMVARTYAVRATTALVDTLADTLSKEGACLIPYCCFGFGTPARERDKPKAD